MLPRVAITTGDPAGIGPEIAEKAAADLRVQAVCEPVIFHAEPAGRYEIGEVSAAAGQAAYDTIVRAVAAARAGEVDAIATAPVNKLAFARAGLPWKGHTDLLGHLCETPRVAMLFYSPFLTVVLATVHIPLVAGRRVADDAGADRDHRTDRRRGCRSSASCRPRIAVAALNPHAGEDGLLGSEDDEIITPAIDAARASAGSTSAAPGRPTRSSCAPRAANSMWSSPATTIKDSSRSSCWRSARR